jgi:hypothetical protein
VLTAFRQIEAATAKAIAPVQRRLRRSSNQMQFMRPVAD